MSADIGDGDAAEPFDLVPVQPNWPRRLTRPGRASDCAEAGGVPQRALTAPEGDHGGAVVPQIGSRQAVVEQAGLALEEGTVGGGDPSIQKFWISLLAHRPNASCVLND